MLGLSLIENAFATNDLYVAAFGIMSLIVFGVWVIHG